MEQFFVIYCTTIHNRKQRQLTKYTEPKFYSDDNDDDDVMLRLQFLVSYFLNSLYTLSVRNIFNRVELQIAYIERRRQLFYTHISAPINQ